MFKGPATSSIAIILAAVTADGFAVSRYNAGTQRWTLAAREGRADMLFLGDSIVTYGNGGWTSGTAQAAQNSIGLAGSGLLAAPYDVPSVWSMSTGARIWSGPATDSVSAGVASLTPSGRHYGVGTNFAYVGSGVDPVVLDLKRPTDWHVFASGTSPAAQLQATRSRRTNSPWSHTILQTSEVQPVSQGGSGLSDYVFRFNGTADPGDWTSFEFTDASRDANLYYTKLVYPDMTGITVSGWSFSGGTTSGFRDAYYNHPRFTADGRTAMYRSLVAGNSGKLNVAIAFGVNDAKTISPDSYGDSIRGLIADVRRDWLAAGLNPSDLSFTLMSSYQVDARAYPSEAWLRLIAYRDVLDLIARDDPQISFIDMWERGPTWQEAVANGYLADFLHPSTLGTQVYGRALMQQLIPSAGDVDIDGDVDFDDLLALLQHYGESGGMTWKEGDFDLSSDVGFEDLLALAQNYGLNAPALAGRFDTDLALARSLAPEPTGLAVLALGSSALSRRRRE